MGYATNSLKIDELEALEASAMAIPEEVPTGNLQGDCKDLLLYFYHFVGFKSVWSMCSYLSTYCDINISTIRHQIYDNPKNGPTNLENSVRALIAEISSGNYPVDLEQHLAKDGYIQAKVFKDQFEEILKYDQHASKRALCKLLSEKSQLHPERIRSYLYGKRHMVPYALFLACRAILHGHVAQASDKLDLEQRGHTTVKDFIFVFKQIENSSQFTSKVNLCAELSRRTGVSVGTIRGYLYHSPQKIPSRLYKTAIKILDEIRLAELDLNGQSLENLAYEKDNVSFNYYLQTNAFALNRARMDQFSKEEEIQAFNRLQWMKIHIKDSLFDFGFVQNYIIKLLTQVVDGQRKISTVLQGKKDNDDGYLLGDIKNHADYLGQEYAALQQRITEIRSSHGLARRQFQMSDEIREMSQDIAGYIRQFDFRSEVIDRCTKLVRNVYVRVSNLERRLEVLRQEQTGMIVREKSKVVVNSCHPGENTQVDVQESLRRIELSGQMSLTLLKEKTLDLLKWARRYESEKYNIFRSNIGLVKWIARDSVTDTMPLEDLMQEGSIGLLEAIERFDNIMGFRFSTYARWWIQRYIKTYLDQQAYITTIPEYLISDRNKMIKQISQQSLESLENPDVNKIAAESKMPVKRVHELMQIFQFPLSLNMPVDEESETQLMDMIDNKNQRSSESITELSMMKSKFLDLFKKLSGQEERVLLLRFGLQDGISRTLREIGSLMGLTRERVRQIEKKALDRMKELLLENTMEWDYNF
jgi:RNA polymerase primary sigma factor